MTDRLISLHCLDPSADEIYFSQAGKASAATVISTIRSLKSKSKTFKSIFDDTSSESDSCTSDGESMILDDDSTDTEESDLSLANVFKKHRKE